MNWILRHFVCAFKGHIPEKYLTETDGYISIKRCKRCHSMLGMPHFKLHPFTPTWLSDQEWAMFCEEQCQKLRDSVKQ